MASIENLPNFGIPSEVLKNHGLTLGQPAVISTDFTATTRSIDIGSQAQFPQTLPPFDYSMPDEMLQFFEQVDENPNAVEKLHIALSTPFEKCVTNFPPSQRTPDQILASSFERAYIDVIKPEVHVLVNPSQTAIFEFRDRPVEVVFTCDQKTLDPKHLSIAMSQYSKVFFKKDAELDDYLKSRISYFGSSYYMLSPTRRGWAYKHNLPNCLVYGHHVITYERVVPDITTYDKVEHPIDYDSKYYVRIRKKDRITDTRWLDPMLPVFTYDPTVILSTKDYRLNVFTVVTTKLLSGLIPFFGSPMYSMIGFGYPRDISYEVVKFGEKEFSTGPLSDIRGHITVVKHEGKIVDVSSPPFSYETRYEIVKMYGKFFQEVKKNYYKVNPRASVVQAYTSDNRICAAMKGTFCVRDETGPLRYDCNGITVRLSPDPDGNHILVRSSVGGRVVDLDDSSAPRGENAVLLDLKEAFVDRERKMVVFVKQPHVRIIGGDEIVQSFVWSSNFVSGFVPSKHGRFKSEKYNLDLTMIASGDALGHIIPVGMDVAKVSVYTKYHKILEN